MIAFPAIDLLDAEVVRLRQGRRHDVTIYDRDPVERARFWQRAGATWVHVVDLSGAFGETGVERTRNLRAIEKIAALEGLSVDVGGGVRSMADLSRLFDLGCSRVSLGTPLVRDPDFCQEALARYGDAMVADVAAQGDVVRVNGWRESTPVSLFGLLDTLGSWGFRHLVFTDVARDGTGLGIEANRYREVSKRVGFPVVASGGVATMKDVVALAGLGERVLEGFILGRALYEGTLDLKATIDVLARESQGEEPSCSPNE